MSTLPNFFYTPRIMEYSFGPKHPLKPERLMRTLRLLERFGVEAIDPGQGRDSDVLRVHSEEYVDAVRRIGLAELEAAEEGRVRHDDRFGPRRVDLTDDEIEERYRFGLGSGDNPAFANMHAASLHYVHSVVRAAEAVRDGAPLAFGIGGGLHHAHRSRASGFCIYNDLAIACSILRERFDRVAYVDIDVHHGDGVEGIFREDPTVLTYSIHEEGKSLWPGTGWPSEWGTDYSAVNVPVQARTTGEVWLDLFRRTALPALEAFQPQAIVLQMGTDIHRLDPLAHLNANQQDWLGAVIEIRDLGLPLVAVGGGGYNLTTVPRMWSSACLTLGRVDFPDEIPADLVDEFGAETFSDHVPASGPIGADYADEVVATLRREHRLFR